MTRFDRVLDNGAETAQPPQHHYLKKAKQSKKYFVHYSKGRYYLIDLTLKKKGHSQKFK